MPENKDYLERLVVVEQRSRSNSHRIDSLEENNTVLTKLAENMAVVVVKQEHVTVKIDEIATSFKETADSTSESIKSREESWEKQIKELKSENKKMVDEIDARVKAIEGKSGKRWESLVEKILFTLAGAVAAYIATRFGL